MATKEAEIAVRTLMRQIGTSGIGSIRVDDGQYVGFTADKLRELTAMAEEQDAEPGEEKKLIIFIKHGPSVDYDEEEKNN